MKVAIYSGEIPSTAFVENLISGLAERSGYEMLLFGKKKNTYHKPNGNIKIHFFPKSHVATLLRFCVEIVISLTHFNRLLKLIKVMKDKKAGSVLYTMSLFTRYLIVVNNLPDIFHVQWIKTGHEWLFLREFGVKVVGSFRGSHINYSPIADSSLAATYRKTFKEYDGFHAVSYDIAKEAGKYSLNGCTTYRIPGAVDDNLVNKKLDAKRINGTLKFVSVGRGHWIKGYSYVLEACRVLAQKKIDFNYTIVGAAGNEELLYLIDDMGIGRHVTLTKIVPHDHVFDYYRKNDLLLLPSLKEGIANVVLEAMATGMPVLSTDAGGMGEVITNGVNGWLVPPRDPKAIVEVIMNIIKGKWDIDKIVANARVTIEQDHLLSGQISAFDKMYKEILNS